MTSQNGSQGITEHLLPNISQSKGNKAMKFSQLIDNYKNNFFKNHEENDLGRLVPDLFLFLKRNVMLLTIKTMIPKSIGPS